jgi:K+-transporting ATPase ATPase A chain
MLALIVQQFISPAIGIVVAVFLSSSIASSKQNYFTRNFYRDITRIISRILVPYSFLLSIAFATLGIINNFRSKISFHGLSGSKYDIPSGPAAALEAIKNIGTNGGGFYNANSAHPFSNPNLWSNSLQIIAFLSIPIALIAVYGHFIGDMKHAHSIAASVLSIALLSTVIATYFESKGYHNLSPNLEGKELRFGNFWSTFYGSLTTLTSNGGVNASHDSFLPLSGFFFLFNIFLGEIAPGGAGSGLYGIIVIAILANFIFGLMLGKLPSYRKKKIGGFEISMASLYILVTPLVFFIFTIINLAFRRVDQLGINTGAHGLTELFYAYASTSGNNGSAFAGFASSDHLMQTLTTFAMFFGRYLPIVIVMALAGSFYKKDVKVGDSSGLPSHGLIFSFNFTLTILVITAITYIPFLLLGPIVDLVS